MGPSSTSDTFASLAAGARPSTLRDTGARPGSMRPPRRRSADVVVVGGGLSGLIAADRIVSSGRTAVVLEARARVGGRLETATAAGLPVDLGGAWIGADDTRARRLLSDLGLATWASHCDGESLVATRGGCRRGRAHRLRHPAATLDARRAARRLDRLAAAVAPARPWSSPSAGAWDAQTLESWLGAATRTAGGRAALRGTLTNVLAADPAAVSLLHALFYVRSSGGLETILAGAGGAQQDLVAGGAQALAGRLAERLGDAVELGAAVRRIEQGHTGVRALSDGLVVEAATAVVALGPALAGRIDYAPALGAERDQLSQSMPHGDVVKVVVVYEQPFWRDEGLSGEAWGDGVPFSFSHDVSPPGGGAGALALFFTGERARRHRSLAGDERGAARREALRVLFGRRAAAPVAEAERDWAREPWSRGAYGGYMPPGAWTRCGAALREPDGRIAWAASETAVEHAGYMEGAIEAGERAAAESLVLA